MAQLSFNFQYDPALLTWARTDGAPVPPAVLKASAEAYVQQARADIGVLTTHLTSGDIDLNTYRRGMRRAVKRLHLSQMALARGGFENLRPQDIKRAEALVRDHLNGRPGKWPGLKGFVSDINRGRYGRQQIFEEAGHRGLLYAAAGNSTYENERLQMHAEKQVEEGVQWEACRILGHIDHCGDCVHWAALGWIPLNVMMARYPNGASVCGPNCHCRIVFRRVGAMVSQAVEKQIAVAQGKAAAMDAQAAEKAAVKAGAGPAVDLINGPGAGWAAGGAPAEFKSSKEVADYFNSKGVPVDFGGRLKIADMVRESFETAESMGLKLPTSVRFDAAEFAGGSGVAGVNALTKEMILNPNSIYFKKGMTSAREVAKEQFRKDYWSSKNPLHALYHELGHVNHDGMRNDGHKAAMKLLIDDHVSGRAAESTNEFVAEMVAMLVDNPGRLTGLPAEIVQYYRDLGGPDFGPLR